MLSTGVKVIRKNGYFFSMSPKDNVSKTRTIYSGRMKTEMPGQRALSNRAVRSKNINKIQIFPKW